MAVAWFAVAPAAGDRLRVGLLGTAPARAAAMVVKMGGIGPMD